MANPETPLMRQYNEIKSRHRDSLLLFRMGDFYELFFEDALVAAKALDIALTSRNKNDPNPVPMCGVPHHSATGYINRLVDLGHKVAICEQLEEPTAGKGIVRRDVIRVISPGTRLDPDALDAKAPNYTHAAHAGTSGEIHWATCDFTTGKFWFGTCASSEAWLAFASSLGLSEVLFSDSASGEKLFHYWREHSPRTFAQTVPAFYFEPNYAADRLREQFGVRHLSAVHPELTRSSDAASCSGALIKYFQESQRAPRIPSAIKVERWGQDHAMELDAATVRALELLPPRGNGHSTGRDASLLSWLDRTKTAMGGRLLRDWMLRPLTLASPIVQRHDEVASLLETHSRLHPALNEIYDLERLLSRISMGSGSLASARELYSLAFSIVKSAELAETLRSLGAAPTLSTLLDGAIDARLLELARYTLGALVEKPPATTREGGMFRKGLHAELDELIGLSENGEQWLAEFEARERKQTGINSLKVRFNRVFGYYIEVTKANLANVPKHYVRKQTMVGGERYITDELKKFEEKILTAEKKRCDMEFALFRDLCAKFAQESVLVAALARAVARVDAIGSLAAVAAEEGYARPLLDESLELDIREGFHPTVAVMLAKSGGGAQFIPNSVRLDSATRFLIITGPNMGGKSTVMRQAALITLLAQMGSFVPAKSARLGIVDRIFTRIGASDNIAEGASTFMVEMSEMSFILRNATERSLILIDEIGRGTSTYDGMSLAWALAADIAERIGSRTLFATHYHELTQLTAYYPKMANARVAVALGTDALGAQIIKFLYKLEPGVAERSYGILVGRLAGLPESLLTVASGMLTQLESQARSPKISGDRNQLQLELVRRPERPSLDVRGARAPEPRPAPAIAAPSPLENWLGALKLEELTPLQALSQLAQWKERLATSERQSPNA